MDTIVPAGQVIEPATAAPADGYTARRMFGARAPRIEDPALLRGEGRYLDDIRMPDPLHAAFLRSPHAHARITRLDLSAARALPGVVAVFDAEMISRELTSLRMPLGLGAVLH
jgi:CO/xanthine dehydrogenase Mo-binding subunit